MTRNTEGERERERKTEMERDEQMRQQVHMSLHCKMIPCLEVCGMILIRFSLP